MIERLIEWSIRNRLLVIIGAVLVGLAGGRALLTMPVDAIPDLSENQVIVFTDWMGRSPQEIEDQITYPLSVNLQGLAGVKVVRSSSEFNFSMINVIFDEKTDYYFARERVLERLSIASTFLPPGVTPYMAPDATALGQIFWYTVEGDGKTPDELRAVQDWFVRYQLNSVPGVAEVASVGGAPREYQVDLDPNKLRAYGITLGEVYDAVARTNSAVGGRVIHKGNAEYLIRSVGWVTGLDDLRKTVVAQRGGVPIYVENLGAVQFGPSFRRSVLEKDGKEAVGGVVLMRYGENPLAVTGRIKEKITAMRPGLEAQGVRVVPFYDRTPLIEKALETVSHTVKEEIVVCSIAILLVMGHVGGAFVVAISLPLAILFSFLLMGLAGIPSNIMSLSGIAISVGILVDQAVVMTDNAAHHLTRKFGREKVRGANLDVIIPACQTVGRPIFFSVLITILSFLPVFALSGMEGKMFHPLAWTKTFALIGVAIFAVTLVPALVPIFLRGRIKGEEESWLVRTMIGIFKPMLTWLMDRPRLVCWLFLVILGLGFVASTRLGREFMPPLDEGSILEMPTSVPRMSVTQVTRDLKARDLVLRTFPEVLGVVGKAGRAETPTDPAPLDMIETIINLRDRELWPKRAVRFDDAKAQVGVALDALIARGYLKAPGTADARDALVNDAAMAVAGRADAMLRELAHRRITEHRPDLDRALVREAIGAYLDRLPERAKVRRPAGDELDGLVDALAPEFGERLALQPRRDDVSELVKAASRRLVELGVLRAGPDLLAPPPSAVEEAAQGFWGLLGTKPPDLADRLTERLVEAHDAGLKRHIEALNWELFDRAVPGVDFAALEELTKRADPALVAKAPTPEDLRALRAELDGPFADRLLLWRKTKDGLVEEMGSALQVPGWGNIFTQPIVNRIDMLATGIRTPVGIKVFGDDLGEIQRVAQEVADVVRAVPGASGVVPDQVVGKGYVEIRIDREKAARYGVQVGDIQDVVEVAMGGKVVSTTVEGRERFPIRVRYARDFRDDERALASTLVAARGVPMADAPEGAMPGMAEPDAGGMPQVPLSLVADVEIVEGPSMIKSENGLLRAYVQLSVHGRDLVGFVEEARRRVEQEVTLPPGMYVEWAGQFEHQARARRTLQLVFPGVVAIIILILYLTYRNWIDALLILPSVLGALAGGAIFQWLFGFHFSVAVWVGYIACFGMATETGIVMLVYLREAIDERGGLANIRSTATLREAILDGAVHRLRPKLLTEGTTILGIAPMLWAAGVGSEVVRPMAAPVLGGLLVADEVIDVFLPVLYFAVQKWRWRRLHGLGAFDPRESLDVAAGAGGGHAPGAVPEPAGTAP
jgi:Cu(I)/Ag(I) efflux system membrane protein CusA/SilA